MYLLVKLISEDWITDARTGERVQGQDIRLNAPGTDQMSGGKVCQSRSHALASYKEMIGASLVIEDYFLKRWKDLIAATTETCGRTAPPSEEGHRRDPG